MILCERSEYFRSLCGPYSAFKESKQTIIELRDDEPFALKSVLRFIYGEEYKDITAGEVEWIYHLQIATTAYKYLMDALGYQAVARARFILGEIRGGGTNSQCIEVLTTLPEYYFLARDLETIAYRVKMENVERLVYNADFRAMMEQDKDSVWHIVQALAAWKEKHTLIGVFVCDRCKLSWFDDAKHNQKCHRCGFSSGATYKTISFATDYQI